MAGNAPGHRVVVTGLGVVSPYGTDTEARGCLVHEELHQIPATARKEFYENLLNGNSALILVTLPQPRQCVMLVKSLQPEAIKKITKFDPEALWI